MAIGMEKHAFMTLELSVWEGLLHTLAPQLTEMLDNGDNWAIGRMRTLTRSERAQPSALPLQNSDQRMFSVQFQRVCKHEDACRLWKSHAQICLGWTCQHHVPISRGPGAVLKLESIYQHLLVWKYLWSWRFAMPLLIQIEPVDTNAELLESPCSTDKKKISSFRREWICMSKQTIHKSS